MFYFREALPSVQFTSPSICAHCGEQQGKRPWIIRSIYGRIFLFTFSSHKSVEFQVPICDQCKTRLEKLRTDWHIAFRACGLGAIVFLCLIGLYPPLSRVWFGLFVLALLCALATMWRYQIYLNGNNIGSYNGKYFRFKNSEFQRQFATLNPELTQH